MIFVTSLTDLVNTSTFYFVNKSYSLNIFFFLDINTAAGGNDL